MTELIISMTLALIQKLVTQGFFAKIIITVIRAFSDWTINKYDDAVADAMADAWGIPPEKLKTMIQDHA